MFFGWGDCEVEPKFFEWGLRGVGVPNRWGGAEGQIEWLQARKFLELEYPVGFEDYVWEPLPSRPAERII